MPNKSIEPQKRRGFLKNLTSGFRSITEDPAPKNPDRRVFSAPVLRKQDELSQPNQKLILEYMDLLVMPDGATQRIVFTGESPNDAFHFAAELRHIFTKTSYANKDNLTLTDVLNVLVEETFPGKEFWKTDAHTHQLRHKISRAITREEIEATIWSALSIGAPLEFGYARRIDDNGEPVVEVKRVNVRSVEQDYFKAKHRRGLRRYLLSRVMWAVVEMDVERTVLHEPTLEIEKLKTKIGYSAHFHLGEVK